MNIMGTQILHLPQRKEANEDPKHAHLNDPKLLLHSASFQLIHRMLSLSAHTNSTLPQIHFPIQNKQIIYQVIVSFLNGIQPL